MASTPPPAQDRKRVKVYELKNNDWFDRGTGFCTGQMVNDESRILVESEDHAERILLETKISKDDGYQKQQDTLIVWTEPNGTDMALSFQEAEGCAAIWEFVSTVQQQLSALAGPDDALSDDAMEGLGNTVILPIPQLNNLYEIDQIIRSASQGQHSRDNLGKFIVGEEYLKKLVPLVEHAENMEDLPSLHRLSLIMKTLILLNDTQIIELVVTDEVIDGVVGALEYDPEFPSHKANHREYLQNKSRFKEVVPIKDKNIRNKIHATWRLQYLKDVVLARILDDPTFSVLNSLIFFNQVDIVTHLQSNPQFLKELFSLIDDPETTPAKRKDAVCFIQQCCAIAKNIQAPARASLYQNFISNGLLQVIVLALGQKEAPIRIAGTDILVAMIDHDPSMVRAHVFKAMNEKKTPLTNTLIDLLLVEEDLGVKAQAADAIKILLDPQQNTPQDGLARMGEQFMAKYRNNPAISQQTESFIQDFYDNGAKRLFAPLKSLGDKKDDLRELTFNEQSLYLHLVEILMYFVRQHLYRSKYFISSESISVQIAQLLRCPQKHLKLTALKFFRTCLSLQDDFYYQQIISHQLFGPILDILCENLPRDNLLTSACMELFEFIKRETIKPIWVHIIENYRDRIQELACVSPFKEILAEYEHMQRGYDNPAMEGPLFGQDESMKTKMVMNGTGGRWQGIPEMEPTEEEYFNASDDEDDLSAVVAAATEGATSVKLMSPMMNGTSPLTKPLVDYPDDDENMPEESALAEDSAEDSKASAKADKADRHKTTPLEETEEQPSGSPPQAPPERIAEKRRREEDDEDELGKLSLNKRRSSSSASATGSNVTAGNAGGKLLRRKQNFNKDGGSKSKKKIAISLTMKSPIEAEQGGSGGGA